jgi:hypothetical protein
VTLYTYTVRVDRGSAPNPFWGICTLAICKPKIRRVAQPGDWVVGFGAKDVDGIDYSAKIVYAMRVHQAMSFKEYDGLCKTQLKGKVPDVSHRDYRRRLGDCIFDYSKDPEGKMRLSVHTLKNRKKDLSGKNVLLSDHFFYFGSEAPKIPVHLEDLVIQQQGHRSAMNDPWKHEFVEWIEKNFKPNVLYGKPQVYDEKCEPRAKENC